MNVHEWLFLINELPPGYKFEQERLNADSTAEKCREIKGQIKRLMRRKEGEVACKMFCKHLNAIQKKDHTSKCYTNNYT